jgi:uncharacterized hydrophobic protein (TIGR00271 family)
MRTAETFSLRRNIEHLLGIDPETKPLVYSRVFESVDYSSVNYWLELLFAAGIATLGLVLNSPAVVIGAMLISPLMGPIIGAGLALASADLYLGLKASLNLILSISVAIFFSALLVWLLPFRSPTSEILARTQPNLLDLAVAIFSGLAGSLVVVRGGGGGGVTALPGVAIAVALMPPLCAAGFGVGSGFSWPIISGAGLLFLTNQAAIIASAFLVFYLVRMDAPEVRLQIDDAIQQQAQHDKLYLLLQETRLSSAFGHIGKLQWRILMPLLVLAVLFIPLSKALLQVRNETISRTAIRDVIRQLVPQNALLSQQVNLTPDRLFVHLIVTLHIEPDKVREAERTLIRRTGREASLSVRKVAGEEELALLREQLKTSAAPPPSPPPQTLAEIQATLLPRLAGPLKEVWPEAEIPLLNYELSFTPEEILVRIRYQSAKPLEKSSEEMMTNLLRTRLGVDTLKLILENEKPSPPPKKTSRNNTSRPRVRS